jgi:hypothetical protein
MWTRLIDEPSDADAIVMEEWVPKDTLSKIICDYIDDPIFKDGEKKKFTAWARRIISSQHFSTPITYQKSDRTGTISRLDDGVYLGSAFVGRSFARKKRSDSFDYMSIQNIPRMVRNTLYGSTHYDIDIKNSHPSILAQLFESLPITCFKEYFLRRDGMVKDAIAFSRSFDSGDGATSVLDERSIKKIVGSIINNCDPNKLGLFGDQYRYLNVARKVPMFQQMLRERELIYEEFKTRYGGLLAMVNAYKGSESVSSALAILLQDVEDEVIRTAYSSLLSCPGVRSTQYVVFLFDGFLYPKDCIEDINAALEYMSDNVKWQLGLKIEFAVKPMEPRFPGCDTTEVLRHQQSIDAAQEYAAWKKDFEVHHYKLMNPVCYVRVDPHDPSKTSYNSHNKFEKELHADTEGGHIKEWMKDPLKRKYESEVFAPPPRIIGRDDCLNTFQGLRAESLPVVDNADVADLVKPILDHVKILGGDDPACKSYLLKWMASRVQKPGFLPKVVIGIRSVEGTGKDSFFSFFGLKVLGKQYFHQAPDLSSLFSDRHCMSLKDKLLVVISECSRSDSNACQNRFKSFITAETVKFRPLYVQEMTKDNYAGFVMFSQDHSFISLAGDDRRFCTMDAVAYLANDPIYFNKLHACFADDRVARAFYQYLMNIDLEGFEMSRDRPMTIRRASLINTSVKPAMEFMKKMVIEKDAEINRNGSVARQECIWMKKGDLYAEYKQFIDEEMPAFKQDYGMRKKFYAEMSQLISDTKTPTSHAVMEVKVRGEIKYKIHLGKSLEYISKLIIDSVPDMHEEEGVTAEEEPDDGINSRVFIPSTR